MLVGPGTIGRAVLAVTPLFGEIDSVVVVARTSELGRWLADRLGYPTVHRDDTAGAEAALKSADVVVDCTPGGDAHTRLEAYHRLAAPVIVQGGEDGVAQVKTSSVNPQLSASVVRIASCNMTGTSRIVSALRHRGPASVNVTYVKCASDPDKPTGGLIDSATVQARSRHREVLGGLFPGVGFATCTVTVPMASHGHVAVLAIDLAHPSNESQVTADLAGAPRVALTARTETAAMDADRYPSYCVDVIADSVQCDGPTVRLVARIPHRFITVPDTWDAVLVALGSDAAAAVTTVDQRLGLGVALGHLHR